MTAASNIRRGPGTGEIVVGGILSVLLGALLASAYLVARPLKVVKAIPDELEPGAVYFIEGKKDFEASRRWMFKREVFVQGQSVEVTEGELNFWIASVYPQAASDAPGDAMVSVGTPHFRIESDELKAGALCRLNLFGLVREIAVQSAGGFVKEGERFVFRPRELRVGGLAVHRLGPLGRIVFKRVAGAFEPPEDAAAAWNQLTGVHVEGNLLVLSSS